ncbi:uncharacterized protein CCOS01_01622 [Colletotrichum costaricense]|uniref:FAD-binding PCMH-type domain-containing protein n=1 Tax=Colletotrichum costaricense TaxID=1209916 RepID=A0AAJ0E4N3_9PEZI|nr:uncharacterized protein CCOS01_01622 [Colletotrichum costaricense]KAK1536302.1 hypothetical protein CCOS01_01622 [Colletotrichum costaricense]
MSSSNPDEGHALKRGTAQYEEARNFYFNREETDRYPTEIHVAKTSQDVVEALRRARELKVSVGIRSGGHLPSKPSLVHNGVLIDVSNINHHVKYDEVTEEVEVGPGIRVYEAWKATDAVGRFFPFGHAPDVALGGFCLAGGQGLFMRAWGATITEWIVRLEIVVPDGRVLIASRTENADLFWAARGGGQAFFGVVTRIWSRTIPKKRLFWRSTTFTVGDKFENLITFAFERNDAMPRKFTESAICVLHPELFDSEAAEVVPESSPLVMAINVCAYADTLAEAAAMLEVWDVVPENIKGCLTEEKVTVEASWEEFFELQRQINPESPGQKWGINSILNCPSVSLPKLIETIKPAMCELPTKSSFGCIYICDTIKPDERDAVFSIPQQYYISTFSGWKDPALVPRVRETMRASYKKAEAVACGIYSADFDQSKNSLHSPEIKVWTDSARARFMEIRRRWDPDSLFTGYKGFDIDAQAKPAL